MLPGTGIKPVIKSIKIGGKEIEKIDILEQLFIRNSRKQLVGMNEIEIEVGRMVKSGSVEAYPSESIKVPNNQQSYIEMGGKYVKTFTKTTGSNLPNWKFTRIQDLFPVYGQTLDFIIFSS